MSTQSSVQGAGNQCGSVPKELVAIGMNEYRQVLLKPYRIIYRIISQQVIIYLIVDGRRDMQTALERRLLGAPTSGI